MQQLLANQQAQVEHIAILTTIFLWQAIWLGEGGMQLIVCVYIPNGKWFWTNHLSEENGSQNSDVFHLCLLIC